MGYVNNTDISKFIPPSMIAKTAGTWTAAATDFATVEVDKITLGDQTVAPAGVNPAVTLDADHDTATERKAVVEHKMTVTITNPEFIEDNEAWYLHLGVSAASGTVFTLYGAQVNYTLRL